jgi:hypothetical protein
MTPNTDQPSPKPSANSSYSARSLGSHVAALIGRHKLTASFLARW